MKKLIAIALLFAAAPFLVNANDLFSVSVEAVRDVFFMRSFSGEFASDKPRADGNLYPYQGGSTVKWFQSSAFDNGLEANLNFRYTGERFGGLLGLQAAEINRIDLDMKMYYMGFSDWEAWASLGPWFDTLSLRILAGNQSQRGAIPQYQNFSDFLKFKNDTTGILLPFRTMTPRVDKGDNLLESNFPYGYGTQALPTGYAGFSTADISDLFIPAGTGTRISGFLFDIKTAPLTLTASVGGFFEGLARPFVSPWYSVYHSTVTGQYDAEKDNLMRDASTKFGIRLESAEIAGAITVAASYKYAELIKIKMDKPREKDSTEPERDTINLKADNHAFGLYANVYLFPVLGLTIGYSGLYQRWNNEFRTKVMNIASGKEGDKDREDFWRAAYNKAAIPFYNGIDLRMVYTGFPDILLTSNSNLSFSHVQGYSNTAGEYREAWIYENKIRGYSDRAEKYTGLNNVLGLSFMAGGNMVLDLQLANQLGIFKLVWDGGEAHSISNLFAVYSGMQYRIIEKAGLSAVIQCGIALNVHSYSYQNPDNKKVYKAGYTDFGIPLSLKVEY